MTNYASMLEDALESLFFASANVVLTDQMNPDAVQSFLRAEQKAERVLRLVRDERRAKRNGV
jgi:hypothetical protein